MASSGWKEVIERHRKRLMGIPGVVGVGLGVSAEDPKSRRILVYTTSSSWPAGLPKTVEGRKIELKRVSGGFRAL